MMENNIVRDDIKIPTIDLAMERSEASKAIIKACEEFGFFIVMNHGVEQEIISHVEEEGHSFFSKPVSEKLQAGPAQPYGYGSRRIGLNGDVGEVEYLLLQANPLSISDYSTCISPCPHRFSHAVSKYVEAMKELASKILDIIVEGLWAQAQPKSIISGLIRDQQNDSLLRFNHYPPSDVSMASASNIGFGAHTDPQIITILRSNGFGGLQISLEDGVWIPVDPHPPSSFCINVGDMLQAMTNGRFVSVKHRVVNTMKSRMSIAYFAAPPLHATISYIEDESSDPAVYRSFSWGEYKEAVYAGRLEDCRLDRFKVYQDHYI